MLTSSLFHVPTIVFLLGAATPSLALDIPTMKEQMMKEHAALRTFHVPSIANLFAEDGVYCLESACFNGKKEIEEAMQGFSLIASISCDTGEYNNCFFLPNINKAACRFTCFGSLVDNPSCVTDGWHGIYTYEWNDAGKLIRAENFGSEDSLTIALATCMPDMKPSKEM
jgi:hypothetical protein